MCQFKHLSIFLILVLSLSGCWICQFLSTRPLSIDVSGLLSHLICQFPSILKTLYNAFTHHNSTQGWRLMYDHYYFNHACFWSCYMIIWCLRMITVMFALKFSLRKQFYYLTYQNSFTEFCLHVNSRKSRYKIYSFEGWTIFD